MASTEHAWPEKFSFATILNIIVLSRLDDAGDWASAFLNRLDGLVNSNSLNIYTATFNAVMKAIVPLGRDKGVVRRAEGGLARIAEKNIELQQHTTTVPHPLSQLFHSNSLSLPLLPLYKKNKSTVMSTFSRLTTTTTPSTVDDIYHCLTTHCRPNTVAYKYCMTGGRNIEHTPPLVSIKVALRTNMMIKLQMLVELC